MRPNQTLRPAAQLGKMRSYKTLALRNFVEWECQTCGADLWFTPRREDIEWGLNFCSMRCSQVIPMRDELTDAFADAIDEGRYSVDAFDVADAMLDGVPPMNATGLRSRQWRERRAKELNEQAA